MTNGDNECGTDVTSTTMENFLFGLSTGIAIGAAIGFSISWLLGHLPSDRHTA